MDSAAQTSSSSSRKRNRENETESQRIKREKAAERQRRKRERDRNNNMAIISAFSPPDQPHSHQLLQQQLQQAHAVQVQHQQASQPQPAQPQQQPSLQQSQPSQPSAPTSQDYASTPELTPTEIARRDRVRAAARERQRKHRMLVKQRKMRELGLDMGSDMMPGMDEVHYRVNADGQYQQVLPHDLQQAAPPPPHLAAAAAAAAAAGAGPGPHEPPFPQGQPLGGQTFASTLLLSFSCAPLLKQHLLRTLSMTNEELASLEPVLAEAWERWDHARRAHYAEQAAKAGLPPPLPAPSSFPVDLTHDPGQSTQQGGPPPPYAIPTNGPADSTHPNEFRARFHRPLVAPTPFRSFASGSVPNAPGPGASAGAGADGATAGASTPGSSAPSATEAIDPHLASSSSNPGSATTNGTTGGSKNTVSAPGGVSSK